MSRPEGKSGMEKMKYYIANLMPLIQQEVGRAMQEMQSDNQK